MVLSVAAVGAAFLAAVDPSAFVDPFIGTAGVGHTTPAACVPFGLVQAGPDTGNGNWEHCSGYQHGDSSVIGFSQTHLNGTGWTGLGDVRLLPFRGDAPQPSAFDHSNEEASPGFYSVRLKDAAASVEIAAAEHSAIYRIRGAGLLRLLVDCAYGISHEDARREITKSDVRLDGADGLCGRNRRSWWVTRDYAFAVRFSRRHQGVCELPKASGQVAPQYVFDFDLGEGGELMVKVGLSAEGGADSAARNLYAEIPDWDFTGVRTAARSKWNEVLGRVEVEGSREDKTSLMTSLYRLFVQPNNIADVGSDPFYSTFSLWDTFRAAHPLYTILAPELVPGMVDSLLEQGRRTGYLPIWTLWGVENQGMIGTHSVPVIVDWFLKESKQGDGVGKSRRSGGYWAAAYAQIKDTLSQRHEGRIKERWDLIDKYGYYPLDEIKGESVSRTMECAYDDWCAGLMAKQLGFADDAAFFFRRAENWRNVFDPEIRLVRGKDSKGIWRKPFNPYALGHGAESDNDFTEGNAFQYVWHVMQNLQGLVEAMGGRDVFVKSLDSLFVRPEDVAGAGCVLDVTGLIGQYVHGNEPSHHVIYAYPQVGHPEKAAERIRELFDRFYHARPDGLCGNDDCGQMSAWHFFSAMGFYPFNPCGGEYVVGAPQVPSVTLRLGGGKAFRMAACGISKSNRFVRSVRLNGRPLRSCIVRHEEIVSGGTLEFAMTNTPISWLAVSPTRSL
ncbi:MAG: GH92 family glycosyl hydrolase [Kiritimatiellae bacterium]|nr:GH92 family glycosyl hydrolase [Kiritimatiellia bacterium]